MRCDAASFGERFPSFREGGGGIHCFGPPAPWNESNAFFYRSEHADIKTQGHVSEDGEPHEVSFDSVKIYKHILFRFPKRLFCVMIYFVVYLFVGPSSSYDRLCGLVVRVSGYRYRGPGFDPRRYQIF